MKTDSPLALGLGTRDRNETPARDIALWRVYLLRAGYLLIAVGMGMQKVPTFLHHGLGADAGRGQFHAARASAAGDSRAAIP
jgi:hypothetical protein